MNWRKVFDYENGHLMWKMSNRGVKAGSVAGSKNPHGYIDVMVNRRSFKAHRIIWEMHNGVIPDGLEIDHINRQRHDNRIENLRVVSRHQNMKNKSVYANNTSGVSGVGLMQGKWRVRISNKQIGVFDTFEEAVKVRKQAATAAGFRIT